MKKIYTLILGLISLCATAQPGTFDETFNQGGVGLYGGNTPAPSSHAVVYKSRIYKSGPNKDKIIIVGRFMHYNGSSRKYIARLNADGTLDHTFTAPDFSNGYLYVVEILDDGNILVGGEFHLEGYRGLARLKDDGSVDTSFMPGPASAIRGTAGKVHALHVMPNGHILVGGDFTNFNAVNTRFTRLKQDGNLDYTFNNTMTFNREIRAIAMDGNKIIVGGFFTNYGGIYAKGHLARLNQNGTFDFTFNPDGIGAAGGSGVFNILPLDGKFYISGKFTHYNGANKRGIARINSDGTLDTTFNTGQIGVTNPENPAGTGQGYNIFSMCLQPDGKILIGGNFTQYNGDNIPKGLTRIYQDGTRDLTFITGTGFTGGTFVYEGASVVRDIQLQDDGRIVVGGDYTQYNTFYARMLARIKTYDCTASAQFSESTGWADDLLPTSPHTYALVHDGVYTIPMGTHLTTCTLEIGADAVLVVANGASITVHGDIVNNGSFIVEDGGSLVQRTNSGEILGDGTYAFKRSTKPVKRYDYTYWSSPVNTFTAKAVSPATLHDKYFKYNNAAGEWQNIPNGNEQMEIAKGYIIRAPQNYSITVPAVYTATFTGKPNNGDVYSETISTNPNGNWSLIGNPYPSAINADALLTHSNNIGINGTIYLWTHLNNFTLDTQTGQYEYSASDYATYNLMGYVAPNAYSMQDFDGKINSGQGFMVEANSTGGKVFFSNAMRAVDGNNQFFRYALQTESQQNELEEEEEEVEIVVPNFEKHRFWLNITNSVGAFNQMMIGYAEGATNDRDRLFDAKRLGGTHISLYSLIDDAEYTIQGRALPFDYYDQIKVGYRSTTEGEVRIAIDHFDALFENYDIILTDTQSQVVHNLKQGPYTFTTLSGTFNDRFTVGYQPSAELGTGEYASTTQKPIVWKTAQELLNVKWESGITQYNLYSVVGQLISSGQVNNSTEVQINLPSAAPAFYVLEVQNQAGETHAIKVR